MRRLLADVVKVCFAVLAISLTCPVFAQPPQQTYTLPDPLTLLNGKRVTNIQTWMQKRRPELIQLFETYVYGRGVDDMPPVEAPVGDFIGYHNRTGEHGQNPYDWDRYLNFADRHFKKQ
jgi:hypothetical protein